MTRINVVPAVELWDKTLLAEVRELPRIPNGVLAGKFKGVAPDKYCLGKGHVLFFCGKLNWLRQRYDSLIEECERRGFNVTYRFPDIPKGKVEWQPSEEDREINRARLKERTPKNRRYYGKVDGW